MGELQR
jgi:hypothetical protein